MPEDHEAPPGRRPNAATLRRQGLHNLLLYLVVSLPLAGLWFLYSADFFDVYHGTALCHRPLPGSDGRGDQVRRFTLEQLGDDNLEVVLPAAAFAASTIPSCPNGMPPLENPENAPTVHKDLFSLQVAVDGKRWPTPSPADLLFPLLAVLLALPVRNWLTTGSPVRLAGHVTPPPILQARAGTVAPAPQRGQAGPPPAQLRGKRGRRKRH